jgi:hypothetical protein
MDERAIATAVRSGIVPNGPALRQPMNAVCTLRMVKIHAIYTYLRTVPKIKNKVERSS